MAYFSKNISEIPLNDLKKMDAEQLLKKFRLVQYSPEDIAEINSCISKIDSIIKKNTSKLGRNHNGQKETN